MDLISCAPDYVRAISPYQPGKPLSELERELGIAQAIKLASNENPLGASPRVDEAVRQAMKDISRYPDGNGFELKKRLAGRHAVELGQIVLGNGSNDLLELAARAFLGVNASAVYAQYSFAVYPLVTQATGAKGLVAPAQNYAHDPETILATLRADTRVVFIANPNNPTGTFLESSRLHHLLRRLPQDVLAVLDEAYTEYLPPEYRYDASQWLSEFPNLLITRTFSKAYGLAGLRVGYALANLPVADLLNRVRQPFNVSTVAQMAAMAALEDQEFMALSYEINRAGLAQLYAGFKTLGLQYLPSFGNFVLFKVQEAGRVYEQLLRKGV
ncbi:MAG: histidinol-phosphate transaminase, partial [Pseudomonadota bacterium]|nr:histidinol-phosphate transaminase [Pseudomonadota bacterium]